MYYVSADDKIHWKNCAICEKNHGGSTNNFNERLSRMPRFNQKTLLKYLNIRNFGIHKILPIIIIIYGWFLLP